FGRDDARPQVELSADLIQGLRVRERSAVAYEGQATEMHPARVEGEPGPGPEVLRDGVAGALKAHAVQVGGCASRGRVDRGSLVQLERADGAGLIPHPGRLRAQRDLEVVRIEVPGALG